MKTFLLPYALTLLLSLSALGAANAELISPVSIEQSDCKGHDLYGVRSEDEVSGNATITFNEGILSLSLENIMEQCAADIFIVCKTDVPGELHFIEDDQSEIGTSCLCYFDVKSSFTGIVPGQYDVYIETKWGTGKMQTSADIFPGCEIQLSETSSIIQVIGEPSGMLQFSSKEILTVLAEGTTTIEAYDSEGRHILKLKVEGKSEIDFSTLPKGIYMLRATNGNRNESIKFVR
ncbi:MAG: T9SS type A sorting domain-containing protein [Muribaculaceae bacterium]|nr:T9SS type A sorting domain-containing protein [Muribaculaceae bacterium]